MKLSIDFETQSLCDLKLQGTDNYAKHPSTEVTTMAYGTWEDDIRIWYPGLPLPSALLYAVKNGAEIWAHNATFEWHIWNFVCKKYGFPTLKLSQLHCTMSMANAMGLPGSLDNAAAAAGLEIKKDPIGYRTMMFLCQPNGKGLPTREEFPDKFKLLDDYCIQDVKIEMALSKRLAPLSREERETWLLDQKINYRGVGIDVPSARKLDKLVDNEMERLLSRFRLVTANQVPTPSSHVKFRQWMADQGVVMDSIAKAEVTKLLDETSRTMPPLVKEAILIRREASKTSNAKIKTMLNTENGGRARGMFEYYGAKQTGRWAGRKIQLQNLPRSRLKFEEIEKVFNNLDNKNIAEEIDMLHGSIMNTVSDCIRSLLIPAPKHKFIVADYSNIEGRGLAWLANETWKIKAFQDFDNGVGDDLYKLAYGRAFKIDPKKVTSDQRQIGKTLELACGYQGSVGAFQTMAKTFNVKVSDERAKELVDAWREANPRIKNFWYALEDAAKSAIKSPNSVFKVGAVLYVKKGSFLCCRLPSGRVMYYPYPLIEQVEAHWGGLKESITYKYQDSLTKKWVRGPTYGGSLAENITQGLCRDILRDGIFRVENAGYPVVAHVHDEIVTEVPMTGSHSVSEFEKLMSQVPDWAVGFPISAKGYEGVRYKK